MQVLSKGPHSKKKHMDWVDENNFGISHFGLHPDLLRRDNMRFDVFHCRSSITRMMMGNLRKFQSFLTKNKGDPRGDETFHMHCLRFHLPKIAKTTLEKDGLGLGIFTMQGHEHRNKEQKNTLKGFCNGRRNILSNNMNRLCDQLHCNISAH